MEMPCVATYKGKVVNYIISIKDENIDKKYTTFQTTFMVVRR